MLKRFFFLLLFLPISISFAQNEIKFDEHSKIDRVEIPKKNIERYKNNPDFNYVATDKTNFIKKIWNWFTRLIKRILYKFLEYLFGMKAAGKILAYIIRALPYVTILLFAYLIFRFLLGIDLIKLKNKQSAQLPAIEISDEEKIIKEENINTLIQQAISQKKYRLATRYYYLLILKHLIDKNLLEWKPEKTNRDYVLETKKYDFSAIFKKLTFIYDHVWYGNFSPDESEFKKIENEFNHFKTHTK